MPSVAEIGLHDNVQHENSQSTTDKSHAIAISPESYAPASDSVHSDAPPIWKRIYSKAEADDIEACSGIPFSINPIGAHKHGSAEDFVDVDSGDQSFQNDGRPSSRSREPALTRDMVDSHTNSSSWSVTNSATSARLLRNAWTFVFVALLLDFIVMAVAFQFQAALYYTNAVTIIDLFWVPVFLLSAPSGSQAPSKAMLLLYEVTFIWNLCSSPVGIVYHEVPRWELWLGRIMIGIMGIMVYWLAGIVVRRLQEKFTGKNFRDQIVSIMHWWFTAASVATYQTISGIASHLFALSDSNHYCELVLGEKCKHRNCFLHGSPCSHEDIVWYHGNGNMTAQWIMADNYITNSNAYSGHAMVIPMLLMVLTTKIAMGVLRGLGPLPLTEQRATRQETLVLWLVAATVALGMAILSWTSLQFLWGPCLIASMAALAWMIHSSTQISAEEMKQRQSVINFVTTAM